MIHQDTEYQEEVYQCQECASLWPGETIAVEGISKVRFCRTCGSRDVRLYDGVREG